MPWGDKKSEIPEELKDLGLTPAQIRQAVLDNKKLVEDLSQEKTKTSTLQSSVSQLEGRFNDTKRTLDELEANSKRTKTPPEEKTYTSFIDDENKAFAERAVDALQPVAQVALRAAANSAKMEAKMSLHGQYITTAGGRIPLSRLWEKWLPEIEKAASEVNLANLGQAVTWTNIFDYIKGRHINELMAEPQTFVESVQDNTDRRVSDDSSSKDKKLNDEELAVIKKQSRYGKGVTPEAYQATKDKMKFVNV
jgi:hypothetical protein